MDTEVPIIQLQNVSKTFRKYKRPVLVLNDINLEIKRTSFTVLSGLSGSGKTTLLKIIGGFEKASSGKVLFNGEDISGLSNEKLTAFRRKNVGMIFQDYYLDENLTFRENIELPAMFADMKEEEITERTKELVEGTDLAERLNHYPDEISGGQAQRAAILRAVYLKPDLILADEPTSNIDDLNAKMVLDNLKDLQQKGHTILLASHDARVLEYADAVIKMTDGKVICD